MTLERLVADERVIGYEILGNTMLVHNQWGESFSLEAVLLPPGLAMPEGFILPPNTVGAVHARRISMTSP